MTTKELRNIYYQVDHCKKGYACEYNAPDGKNSLIKLGSNSGLYGWNWTVYLDNKRNTLYISYYRNIPAYIEEK